MRSVICVLGVLRGSFCLAAGLARGPYLADASSTTAVACWTPAGEAAGDRCRVLRHLKPGSDFPYKVPGSTEAWTGRALPARGRFTFAAFGDSGEGNKAQARVAAVLRTLSPDFVLLLGDVVYPTGRFEDYDRKYFRPYAALLSRIPFFPAPGNHDYGNYHRSAEKGEARLKEGYFRVFRRPKYYSFDVAGAHFASLDTNAADGIPAAEPVGPDSAQVRWLKSDLERSRAKWKIVLMHVPLYASFHHGDYESLQRSLEPLFEKYGVDLVLQGHDHIYERSKPINGVLYVVAGTGGSLLRDWPERKPWVEKQIIDFGLAAVVVDGPTLELKWLDAEGKAQDDVTLRK